MDTTETGKPCQACGHPTTPNDPATLATDGARIHHSHTTDPRSGYYGQAAQD